MNKRQWLTLALGVVAAGSVLALGTKRLRPPLVGPWVEYAPGQYSVTMTEAVTPPWAVLAALGLVVLTGALMYRSRSQNTR